MKISFVVWIALLLIFLIGFGFILWSKIDGDGSVRDWLVVLSFMISLLWTMVGVRCFHLGGRRGHHRSQVPQGDSSLYTERHK